MATQRICDDLLFEIFLRVPIKYIFRLKCLSKMWYRKLSGPEFRSIYESKQQQEFQLNLLPLSGFFRGSKIYFIRSGDLYPDNYNPGLCFIPSCLDSMPLRSRSFIKKLGFIVASSNGIILSQFSINTYFVCNPIINRWFRLPTPKSKVDEVALGFVYEEFIREDGSRHPKYLVVRADCSKGKLHQGVFKIETYSSDIGIWEESSLKAANEFELIAMHGCQVVGNTFYWYAHMCYVVAYDHSIAAMHGWVWLIEYIDYFERASVRRAIFGESNEGYLHYGLDSFTKIRIYKLSKRLHCYNYYDVVPASEWIPTVQINVGIPYPMYAPIVLIAFHPQNARFVMMKCNESSCIFWYDVELMELAPVWRLNIFMLPQEAAHLVPHYQPTWPPLVFQNNFVF